MLTSKPWKPEAILQLLLGVFACNSIGVLAVVFIVPGGTAAKDEWKMVSLLISALSLHGGALLLYRHFLKQHEIGWRAAFGFGSPRAWLAVLLAVLGVCTAVPTTRVLAELSQMVMTSFDATPVLQHSVQTLKISTSLSEQIYFGAVAVLLAPVVEEILFRGILYPFIKGTGHPYAALWVTSLVFGVVHANVATFVPLVFLAILLTALYERTNNLLAPILTHALFNAVNFYYVMLDK